MPRIKNATPVRALGGTFRRVKTKERIQPGEGALREIRKYQHSTSRLVSHRAIVRVVRDYQRAWGKRWGASALEALHEASEAYLVGLFERANLAALHAGRTTVLLRDWKLALSLSTDLCDLNVQSAQEPELTS